MSYFGAGGREVWKRFIAPPFRSSWRWAADLLLQRRRREAAGQARASKAAEHSRHVASWQRSHGQ